MCKISDSIYLLFLVILMMVMMVIFYILRERSSLTAF